MSYDVFTCVCACVWGGARVVLIVNYVELENRTIHTYVCTYV